ncbi:MAG: Gfo/Idh/MocA family oxidoreductase [Clostridia bacterium]|nr:Gfo/Idh/MocA family oxidoreductase [Clostridia bacterium]
MDVILVGHGLIAQTHLSALRALGHTVTWVVGRHAEKAAAFAAANGIPHATASLAEALQSDAGAVHICTPPTQHFAAIQSSLAAGKHVLTEKPLCISTDEAETLAALALGSDRVTAVNCNVRFYPANRAAAEQIRSGAIGQPLLIAGSYLQKFHAPPHGDGWRFDPALSGNQRAIGEIGTHWIDLSYAWTGLKITAVSAALGNWYPVRYRKDGVLSAVPPGEPVRVETEDAAAVTLRFENGAIGTLLLSEVSRGHGNDLSLEIAGTDGTLRWEESAADALLHGMPGAFQSEPFAAAPREQTFTALFSAFYAAVEGRPHPAFPTFADALYVARVCDAIRQSGETGLWVPVAEN